MTLGDSPMENAEVIDAQLTAVQHLVICGLPLYTDFGVWGPDGTRVERSSRRGFSTQRELGRSTRLSALIAPKVG